MKKATLLFPYHPVIKVLGFILVLFALSGLVWKLLTGPVTFPLDPVPQLVSLGLIFIFFSREKIDDERIHQIKFRSLSLGFLYSYFMTFGFNHFEYVISAHEFVAFAMAFATITYYFGKSKS